ncbi:MAG: nitrite reductase (NAD(P)H), partial [Bacteroidota bacterium]
MPTQRILLIGNGMVGHKFCELFAAHPQRTAFELLVFGEERRPAYDRVHLSEFFTDRDPDRLALATKEWYEEQDITLRCGERISEIATEE